MFSFAKRKKSGWTAVCLYSGRVDVARVSYGNNKPKLELLQSYERTGDDAAILRRLGRALGLSTQSCTTLLSAGSYQFLQTDGPDVPKDELREALRWQVKDLVDFPVEQATLDVLDIPQPAGGSGRHMVYVVISRNDQLLPLITHFNQADVELAAIDVPEMAQRNLAALCEEGERGLALLSFDDTGGLLTFTAKGELYMVRRVEVGLRQLLEADDARRDQLLDRIGLELQRSLDNFDRQYSFIPVNRLLLSPGPFSQLLKSFLGEYLGMPVDVLELSSVLDISDVPELNTLKRQAACLATIGAALRREGQI
jgi:MSHA biogenesis protein MshI